MKKITNYIPIEKSRKQDAEANVRKGMTLITCTLQVKKIRKEEK